MLKNMYSLITDWDLMTWYITDVSKNENPNTHTVIISSFRRSHFSFDWSRVENVELELALVKGIDECKKLMIARRHRTGRKVNRYRKASTHWKNP